jgi:pimeloyl-ACP methyl ester carboxylesterase
LGDVGLLNRAPGTIFDVKMPPGNNYDKAEFRLWIPEKPKTLKGIIVLVHASNMDARPWVETSGWNESLQFVKLNVSEYFWHDLAERNGFGLLGCYFTDMPHEDMFIEEYTNVRMGSGQALLDALKELATLSGHTEVADAPLALWGASAGGQFNYEFTCWRPNRVVAFVLNKGGIYFTALASQAARRVPGILFIGDKDSQFRNDVINGIFVVNRRAGARWALVVEPGAVHEIGRSLEMSEVYFDEVIPIRLPEKTGEPLHVLNLEDGYLGEPNSLTYSPYDEEKTKEHPVSWLPTERFARAWLACGAGKTLMT